MNFEGTKLMVGWNPQLENSTLHRNQTPVIYKIPDLWLVLNVVETERVTFLTATNKCLELHLKGKYHKFF